VRNLFETAKRSHPLSWVVEPLENLPDFLFRPWFSGRAAYLNGKLVLFLVSGEEPWNGILIPTERVHHAWLMLHRPSLAPHSVLGKWLYLSEDAPQFEEDAKWLVVKIKELDPHIGVIPKPKRKKKQTQYERPH
jgi:hypothetical protein